MIEIAKDREGLRQAALEMIEEIREQGRRGGDVDISSRTLSPGYYLLLCRVQNEADAQLKAGIPHSEIALDEDDLLAWSILEELCAEFVRENPTCTICGALLRDWREGNCAACGKALANSKGRMN